MVFEEGTLRLVDTEKYSFAAGSAPLRGCLGRRVIKINGITVETLEEVMLAGDGCSEVNMYFSAIPEDMQRQRGLPLLVGTKRAPTAYRQQNSNKDSP